MNNLHEETLPVVGLVLGAPVPGVLVILLGTLIPLGLAVLMFLLVICSTHKSYVYQRVQNGPRPSK